ncbi:TPA: integrating conjugative element protein [Pseudomonas aeruginosa]|uniref:integrating conjugative element protein n=1 Tax=Pseudomonas aeruginosa TaxID=287 RepID=UPI001DEBB824|nr:integrating conjugative element protein [Pseudomonas aeruginosa]MBX6698958.1 integrating conjugative element protein [Pseudomonas aeruginosa]WMX07982.1 integrating conjugative element protein [Pseudomonas aeruginosa]HCF4366168.1 integrating conjugative element protein [Pseudomonas aeruginosa]HCF4370127.1 integrating conjugative element protein [Pseudomonas aeruginosa]HCF4411224.1 integrating conjugative element protein [Pseudomonas aeruginosa]
MKTQALLHLFCVLLSASLTSTLAAPPPLIVVEDRGGASALPYYQALDLPPLPAPSQPSSLSIEVPQAPAHRFSEADMLPVRSTLLTPGDVQRRAIQAPGLRPLFLIGDDPHSRAWLEQRLPVLRDLEAVGLVVNVESAAALEALRRLATGLPLSPAPGDDLAQRLGIRHYPVLITATGIEQ